MYTKVESLFPVPVVTFELLDDLSEIQKDAKLQSYSSINNTLNKISLNKDILEQSPYNKLKSVFDSCIKTYLDEIICPSTDIELYITSSWLNFTEKNQKHHAHWHPNSLISGVFYISTDENLDKILFHSSRTSTISIPANKYNLFNSPAWWIPARQNNLILFPSSLEHEVPTVETDSTRISLSFNTFIRGELSDKQTTTWLNLK